MGSNVPKSGILCQVSETHTELIIEIFGFVFAAGDSGSTYGAATAVGGACRGGRGGATAGVQLHGQTNPKHAGPERHTPGGNVWTHSCSNNVIMMIGHPRWNVFT